MAKIFITGSSDGLGLLAAKQLVSEGHEVFLHARSAIRAQSAMIAVPGASRALIADLSDSVETKRLAAQVNELGRFDAIIHNAAVYKGVEVQRSIDGLPLTFAINTLAPYILTCLIQMPQRLVYMSSDMHMGGDENLTDLTNGKFDSTYSDTKLHDLMLAKAVARKWPDVYSNAVHPGWVPTKMGGSAAPDDLTKGFETQTWLAVSEDAAAKVTGHYFHHKKATHFLHAAADVKLQEQFLGLCEKVSGVPFPTPLAL
jgi:NAD(P)-dependent dehydrogenase (short-subunit alcohol dehydrogenase family)